MAKAGIVLDDYKMDVYMRRLTEAGYTVKNNGRFTEGTTALTIVTDNVVALRAVLEAAEAEVKQHRQARH